jgi:hypothetical protein
MTSARTAAVAAGLTLGLAAASWVIAIRQMNQMDSSKTVKSVTFPNVANNTGGTAIHVLAVTTG